jgi:hypothetical protein
VSEGLDLDEKIAEHAHHRIEQVAIDRPQFLRAHRYLLRRIQRIQARHLAQI